MAGKTLDVSDVITPDQLAIEISNRFIEWNTLRQTKLEAWTELRKYIYATSTKETTNSKLPWKNKTTLPKLTHIRDSLQAHYISSLFPKRLWLEWLAETADANGPVKRDVILGYMRWTTSQPMFKTEIHKCVSDFLDYGNVFGTVEWIDQRNQTLGKMQAGYVGPVVRRISPLDIVFNPIAPSFYETPKIIRSYITLGELKQKLEMMSNDENRKEYEDLFNYVLEFRSNVHQSGATDLSVPDTFLRMDGFESFKAYLDSDYVELLTFYGDLYDKEKNEFLKNHVIMVVDRHKLISKKPNPSFFGYPPIFHVGWRIRQDNLWAMGVFDNLVGLQYRLDHVENIKADVYDLIAFPVLKIKGFAHDFEWGPLQRIYLTDKDCDVEMVAPAFQILQSNDELSAIENRMEFYAGSPREALGFRTPGEKTAYEIQRMENAASRVFQHKIMQFEEQFLEPVLNAMLEMARRNITGTQEINVFDDDFKIQTFMELSADDITGAGRIKPLGARHFAERAEIVQNLTNMYSSAVGQDAMVLNHFSSIKMAQMLEKLLNLEDFGLVQENIRIAEQLQAQKLQMVGQEEVEMTMNTASGMGEDFDMSEMEKANAAAMAVPPETQ